MKRLISFVLLGCITLLSCERRDVAFEQTIELDNNMMVTSNPLVFTYEHGKDTFQLYQISLAIKHQPNLPYMQIPFTLGLISQSGGSSAIPIAIPVFDKKKQFVGKPQADSTFLLEQVLFYSTRLSEGKNIVILQPASYNDTLVGISSITFAIDKVN